MEAVTSQQEKTLANLRIVTLSSQFRPHFILNALNTIGSRMHNEPEMESVLSRLGESINLIFGHAQKNRVLHPFPEEWALVESAMHIQQLMYLKDLLTNLPDKEAIAVLKDVNVPLGLLQIPVENALLHGLRNREHGPWELCISIYTAGGNFVIVITDNGVGRMAAGQLSNATSHGTGTKNISAILDIINADQPRHITLCYEDNIFSEQEGRRYGTRCIITIPESFHYTSSNA
jgi:sensor histidine kinase YesM